MPAFDTDLFVIGAGSGGVRAARIAANHGAKVAVAEDYRVGGTCVIRGCVPKKLLVYASRFHGEFEDAKGFGWSLDAPKFDWPTLIANKDKEIDRLEKAYRSNLERSKVEIIASRAVLLDGHNVLALGKDGGIDPIGFCCNGIGLEHLPSKVQYLAAMQKSVNRREKIRRNKK